MGADFEKIPWFEANIDIYTHYTPPEFFDGA